MLEAARCRGETAIGYQLLSESGDTSRSHRLHTDPKKSEPITFSARDKVIILAES